MRPVLLLTVLAAACTPVDELVGSYNFMVTGSDMVTTNPTSTTNVTGTGTIAVTHGLALDSYDVTIAQSNSTACTVKGTQNMMDPLTVDLTAGQSCTFQFTGGDVTATFTSGSTTEKTDAITVTIAYTFSGSTLLGNFGGNGTRTYTGPRF